MQVKKIIFIVIVAAFVLPMFLKGPDGEPIMQLSDWIPSTPDLDLELPSVGGLGVGSESNGSVQNFYRYKDANGNWQYSDVAPSPGEYELVEVDTNANIIQPTDISMPQETEPQIQSQTESSGAPGIAGYIENMQNVKQDAEAIQGLMDNRESQLESQIQSAQ